MDTPLHTDEQIIAAVRSGEYVLVPGGRNWHVGRVGDIDPDLVGVFVELREKEFECEDQCAIMMGALTDAANSDMGSEQPGPTDDQIPF